MTDSSHNSGNPLGRASQAPERNRWGGHDERGQQVVEVMGREPSTDDDVQLDHLFQARLPLSIYAWLRTQWYERRVPMNSVVVVAITALRANGIPVDYATTGGDDDGTTQRFTVRLPVSEYEWLRAEAFHRRVSINRLLALALIAQGAAPAPRDEHGIAEDD